MRQLFAGGVQRVMDMENNMFLFTDAANLFLVLMIIGAGFMYIQTAVTYSCSRSCRFLLINTV